MYLPSAFVFDSDKQTKTNVLCSTRQARTHLPTKRLPGTSEPRDVKINQFPAPALRVRPATSYSLHCRLPCVPSGESDSTNLGVLAPVGRPGSARLVPPMCG